MDSGALGYNNKDAGDQSLDWNIVETEEDMKFQDTHVDHIVAEDTILEYDLKETNTTADMTNGIEGTVSCGMEERNIENVVAGYSINGTDKTHADGQDAHDNFVTGCGLRNFVTGVLVSKDIFKQK
ncbi:hypothetical protein ABZP36_013546 [Zizania latifolia]